MPELSRKLNYFSESVIRRMTRIANKYDAVNLSQGFPDFDPPQEILDALNRMCSNGPHQYAVTWGAQNFRDAVAEKQSRFMGINIDPDKHIVATCGSTEAMIAVLLTICDPGDKVIVFSPFYENYGADSILAGAEPIYIPLIPPDFGFDRDLLADAFKQNPKAIILCNPSNPTGKVFTREELSFIAELAVKYDAFVVTDEVYEHIVYEPHQHIYMASLPGMFDRTISCSSLSKTYSITGWRLGYIIAPEKIINEVKKVHDFLTVGAPAPLQEAAIAGLTLPDGYYQELRKKYTDMKTIFLSYLKKAGLSYTEPQGAYYVLVNIGEFGFQDDIEFAEWLIRNVGVASVPGSSFFREPVRNYVRFHFAKKPETLKIAGERLLTLRNMLEK